MSSAYSTLNLKLSVGGIYHGFAVETAEDLPEISGTAYVMRHNATGARVMWLACPDGNKAFSIAFKTPPANDTGVFHILEHSVLCGSSKFPVKEPFVHLLKSSMQTFLNALTFSDKTMYPVASTNDHDLENLMEVYLDAVLHPSIYSRPRIFEQEGWHYELGEATDEAQVADGGETADEARVAGSGETAEDAGTGSDAEGADASAAGLTSRPLTCNGVVYNEMKGALSDPDEILIMGINRQLFGETPYGRVSGGDPAAIPSLTYEEFLDTHARHYQLSNSYSILYGDLDIDEKLAFLDERFMSAEDRHAGDPNPLPACPARVSGLVQIPMQTTPDNACVGVAYVFARSSQRERVLAADILVDALVGSNEAPLKRAVLESGLGQDVSGFLYDGLLQPILIFELKGAKPGVAEEFQKLVEDTCATLAREGLGQDNLEASLAQAEFNLREGDWGYPDGIGLAIQAMSGWLYDDADATLYLRYEDALAHMHEGLTQGYFERLLSEAICGCNHKCLVEVVPTEEERSDEAQRLAAKRAELSDAELAGIAREAEELHAEQAAPDTSEALATLPRLELSDIGDGPAEPETVVVEAPVPCFRHDIDTRGIDYAYFYFGLDKVSFEELPYVSVLAGLLGRLDTETRSAYELDTICESKLGFLSFFTETYNTDGDEMSARPKLVVGASALSSNVEWLAKLPAEVWSTTKFTDRKRIADILTQRRLGMEQSFVNSGHAAALSRVNSQFMASSVVAEKLGGVDFYLFLRDLVDHFDERAEELESKLGDLCRRIFSAGNCEMSITGPGEDAERFWEAADGLALASADESDKALVVPAPQARAEAFVVPANVCFVAEGMAGLKHGTKSSGTWRVASQALSYEYLWNEVRVLGGAYGCGFRCTTDALLEMYSFRDPAVDPTIRRFEAAAEWLANWEPTDEELEGFIVASVAGLDAPVKPRQLGRRLDAQRLSGRGEDWRERRRSEVLATTADELRDLARPLAELPESRGICVFGGKEQIAASALDLDIRELFSA